MAKKIIFWFAIISLFNLISCSKLDPMDNYPYYKFSNADNVLISKYNYTTNQVITYENQFGEQVHFRVISNDLKKYGYYSGTFSSTGSLDYYYDSKIVRLEIIENQSNFSEEQVCYIFSKSDNHFKSGINFPTWNLEQYYFLDEMDRTYNIDLGQYINNHRVSISVNGHLFDKVITIQSGVNEICPDSWGALLPNNVNKLYYDYDFGIIQFNDLDGKEWKVIYPE